MPTRSRLRRLLAVGACVTATALSALTATASAASAAASTPHANAFAVEALGGRAVAVHQASALKNQSLSPNANCTVPSPYGNGETPCGDVYSWVTYSNGSQEWFAVGTDYHIYHIWAGSGGWQSLGGTAANYAGNGVWAHYGGDSDVWIYTTGTDNAYWCNMRGIPHWTGWSTNLCATVH